MELTREESKKIHNNQEFIQYGELEKFDSVRAIRLRFLTDRNFPMLDFSYLLVEADGVEYKVINVPFYQIPKKKWKSALYKLVKEREIFIEGLFDSVSIFWG